MTPLVLIRHGPTRWNVGKRLQGHTDIPLSEAGRERVRSWRVPAFATAWEWWCSPLLRARETAELLGIAATPDRRLIEMNYGDFEGRTIAELRAALGAAMLENEARGLDFTPPGGESPRQVQRRLARLLRETGARGQPAGWVTHKGVIRALLALATGWDMTGRPPVRLDWSSAHLIQVDAAGAIRLDRPNIPLGSERPADR